MNGKNCPHIVHKSLIYFNWYVLAHMRNRTVKHCYVFSALSMINLVQDNVCIVRGWIYVREAPLSVGLLESRWSIRSRVTKHNTPNVQIQLKISYHTKSQENFHLNEKKCLTNANMYITQMLELPDKDFFFLTRIFKHLSLKNGSVSNYEHA